MARFRIEEQGVDKRDGRVLVEVDERYFRPTEVDVLLGDASKARQRLGSRHKVTFDELVREMVDPDLAEMRRDGDKISPEAPVPVLAVTRSALAGRGRQFPGAVLML